MNCSIARHPERTATFALVALLLATGCGPVLGYGLPPKGKWQFNQSGHYILSDWYGTTAVRTLYGYDGTPIPVVVLEDITGPGASEPYPFNPELEIPDVYYPTHASKGAIYPNEVPSGLRVRVDGFLRPGELAISLKNDTTGRFNIARRENRPGPGKGHPMATFPIIKTRRIYEVRPDGTERLLWETDRPFDML